MAPVSNAATLVAKVPAKLEQDPGLLYERARWRRRKDMDDEALAILEKLSAAARELGDSLDRMRGLLWGVETRPEPFDLAHVLQVLVEGGPRVAASFHEQELVDRYVLHLAPALMGAGRPALDGAATDTIADLRRGTIVSTRRLGDDIEIVLEPGRTP